MSKFLALTLGLVSLLLLSCGNNEETVQKPIGPTSNESDMPWNRPTGPEGGGALGGLMDQR
ncbi:MAG: hypothetical protein ACPG6P_11205 [Akkermansiaceae bacterium]